jgi:hypothetical protein
MFGKRRKYYYPRKAYRREKRWPVMFPRRRRRGMWRLVGEFLSWLAFLSLITGGIIGAAIYFVHTRFDDALRTHVEAKFRAAYPKHRVAIESAQWIEGQGIELRGVSIAEASGKKEESQVLRIDELVVQSNAGLEELIAGKLNAKQVIVRRLKLIAVEEPSGTCKSWSGPRKTACADPSTTETGAAVSGWQRACENVGISSHHRWSSFAAVKRHWRIRCAVNDLARAR